MLPGTIDRAALRSDDLIVCADGGYDHALAAGIAPVAVIGDFDSTDISAVSDIEKLELPAEKDDTDTLAAVKWAIGRGCGDFLIIGGLSGRFDHSFAVIQTLSFLTDMGCTSEVIDGGNRVYMISGGKRGIGEIEIDSPFPEGAPQSIPQSAPEGAQQSTPKCTANVYFSVYSYTERSEGVTITGAKYPLDFAILTHSYPLGTSNEFLPGEKAVISVVAGRLLIIVSEEWQMGKSDVVFG
jgi:thiamine pyrophosphokinase